MQTGMFYIELKLKLHRLLGRMVMSISTCPECQSGIEPPPGDVSGIHQVAPAAIVQRALL